MSDAERTRSSSASTFESSIGFSRAVRVRDRIVVSGTAPLWPNGNCPDDVEGQARRCFEIIAEALEQLGAGVSDVVRTRMYLTSTDDADAVGRVHAETFGEVRPAATMLVVAALLDPRWRIEVEAEAVVHS